MNNYQEFVGKVLDGRYKILELVGIGGMSCVLKAQDIVMNRIVAIKILNEEYNGNEQAEARFIDESKAVAMLSNKNIVSVYDVAIYPDIKYIVMEYLDGITLREYLDNKGVLGWKEASIYILQILRALEHAHSKGIIHRDIKPQNVILMKNGDIRVTDFGIAKLPNSVSEQNDQKAIGTVYYISPEQACGKETDYYSDIYSVGVMFYEAVTGTLPFTAETPMDVAMMQVNDDPIHPRDIVLDIPVGVSQIILKAMEKSPGDRFQSAHTMVKAIEWILRNPDVIFAMNSYVAEETAGKNSVVSIDMIATAEIQPYNEEEIAVSLGKKNVAEKPVVEKSKSKTVTKKKKPKKSRSMFPIIAGVSLAFFIVAALILGMIVYQVFVSDDNTEIADEAFPDIVGEIYSTKLKYDLEKGKYGAECIIDANTEIIEVYYENEENNKILATEPAADHRSKPTDGKLYFTSITVNRSEKVFVPYLEGYSKTKVETLLNELDLNVEFIETSDSANPYYFDGQAIDSYPLHGAELKVGDTVKVYIYTKTDNGKTAKMPNLIGMTQTDALKYAQTYSLYTVEFVEAAPTIGGNYTVVSQSIPEGTIAEKGTVVTLTISVPMAGMPNLLGLNSVQAANALSQAVPGIEIPVNYIYFMVDEANMEYISFAANEHKTTGNIAMFTEDISAFGAILTDIDDGFSTVAFQSVPENTDLSTVTSVDLIIIQYVTDLPAIGDESDVSDGISSDGSGVIDDSSDVSSDTDIDTDTSVETEATP